MGVRPPSGGGGGGAHPDLATHDTMGLATQAELDAQPKQLGYAQVTANQSAIGTVDTDLTGLTVAVTVGTRLIIVEGFVNSFLKLGAAGYVSLMIFEGTTQLQRANAYVALSNYGQPTVKVRLAPSAGAHTYKLRASAENNTCELVAAATYPAFIRVYEV